MRNSPRSSTSLFIAVAFFSAFLFACGKPFNVRTKVPLREETSLPKVESKGVAVEAVAIVDEDSLYDAFDANLIIAGILPVKVRLKNATGAAVDLKSLRFALRSETGAQFAILKPGTAYKRLISYYDVSAWTIAGYKESRSDFESYSLKQETPLAAGDTREGLLFFRLPVGTAQGAELKLVVTGLSESKLSPLELKLGSRP